MGRSGPGFTVLIIASFVATALAVPAIPAADYGNATPWQATGPSPDYSRHSGWFPDTSLHGGYRDTPAPLTIYHVELDRGSLPGPRDMAYGPGVIALTVDPLLPVLLVAVVAIVAGTWYMFPRNDTGDDDR